MAHAREVEHYEGQLAPLAEAVGQLAYDQLAAFLGYLAKELADQSEADVGRGRQRLSHEIGEAQGLLQFVIAHVDEAWRISAPHMTPEERGET